MRDQHAVFDAPGCDLHLVTRHDLITPIVRDIDTFSNEFGQVAEPFAGDLDRRLKEIASRGWPYVPTLLTLDPPRHDRYRMILARYFTPRRVEQLRPDLEKIVDRLIDAMPNGVPFDAVQAFAIPLPVEAIAYVLGLPTDRIQDLKRWSDDCTAASGARPSDERLIEAQEGVVELQHFLAGELELRRTEPRGDLLSDLVEALVPTGETAADGSAVTSALDMAEMLSLVRQLLVAGNETTTSGLAEAFRLLAENPGQWDALRADPAGRAEAVTEEVLRLASPLTGMYRRVTRDTEIDGCPIPAGARLVPVYAAANRDPAVWGPDPDLFDPDRPNLRNHFAFGKGVHFCIGAPLARLELRVAIERVSTRLREIRLDDENTFEYLPNFILHGLKSLSITVAKAE